MQIITKRDKNIYYLLLQKVNDPYLAKYIYDFMNEMETLDYHIERWETISYKYFKSFRTEHSTMTMKPYSYVFNGEIYVCEADRDLSFYYETGISYQIRDLLLMIIIKSLIQEIIGYTQYMVVIIMVQVEKLEIHAIVLIQIIV